MIKYCVNIDELSEELKKQFANLKNQYKIEVVKFEAGTHEINSTNVAFQWSSEKPIEAIVNGIPNTFLRTEGYYKGNPTRFTFASPTTVCFFREV